MQTIIVETKTLIKHQLGEVAGLVSGLKNENFDESIASINNKIAQIYKEKEILLDICTNEDLNPFLEEIQAMTKLIQEKFDNLIEKKRKEAARIEK